jgi:crotonobetainyl-CoA:carnitine CoA-transferase CaiB-like acyl-CoA transferase
VPIGDVNQIAQSRSWQLLDSVSVVELGGGIASGLCARLLMGLGAASHLVEPPQGSHLRAAPPLYHTKEGQQRSATFDYLSAGKTAAAADTSTAEGQGYLNDLLAEAQVLLVEGRTETLLRDGIDLGRIRQRHPQLVIGQITVFGDKGAHADYLGAEFQAQALGGLMHMVGTKSREPLRLGGYQMHYAAALGIMSSIVVALYEKQKRGAGQLIQVSLMEAAAFVEWKGACQFQHDGARLSRGGSIGPFILRCKDGHSAFYYRERNWALVCRLFEDPRLTDPRFESQAGRDANRADLAKILGDLVRHRTKRDIYHKAQALGMPVGYCATADDILSSPQNEARAFLIDLDAGGAEPPGRIPQVPWTVNGIRPALGSRVPGAVQRPAITSEAAVANKR